MVHSCDQCEKTFKTIDGRRLHVKRVHKRIRFNCQFCDKSFGSMSYFKWHTKIHTEPVHAKCDHCSKSFVTNEQLKWHQKYHQELLEDKKHECPICTRMFHKKSARDKHITEVHTAERPSKCKTCGKRFKSQRNLKAHQVTHSLGKSHKCSVCSASFYYSGNLKRHQKTHMELPLHSCPRCPKKYRWAHDLKQHLKLHNGKVRIASNHCIFCGRSFIEYSKYLKHLIHHVGEKPFNCELCNKDFCSKSGRDVHIKRRHTLEKFCECGTCGLKFTTQAEVRMHSRIHLASNELKRYSCVFCEKRFNDNPDLFHHIRSHIKEKVHTCHVCKREFSRIANMKNHFNRFHKPDK